MSEMGDRSPGIEVAVSYELPWECWELNLTLVKSLNVLNH